MKKYLVKEIKKLGAFQEKLVQSKKGDWVVRLAYSNRKIECLL